MSLGPLSRFLLLRHHDPMVWAMPWTREQNVHLPFLPTATKKDIDHEFGCLEYRSVTYFSENPDYPYVRLVQPHGYSLPLVRCCDKKSYDAFLQQRSKGRFKDVNATVYIPVAYREMVCDL